jgi:hypothetical protein
MVRISADLLHPKVSGKLTGWFTLILCSTFYLLSGGIVLAQTAEETYTGHAYYGTMVIPNDDPDTERDDYDFSIYGADAQMPIIGRVFKLGIEAGAHFSQHSETRRFSAYSSSEGGAVVTSLVVDYFLIDYYFGGYLGFEPSRWFRLSVGAGPLLIGGFHETESRESSDEEINSESEFEVGAGLYARAGIDIFISEIFGIHIGSRINETTLSIEDAEGEVDIEGWQYYFGMAFRF